MTVILGTTVNYYLDDKINKAEILFPGVGCFFIAVLLGSAVHASNAADYRRKIHLSGDNKFEGRIDAASKEEYQNDVASKDVEEASDPMSADDADVGSADYLLGLEKKRAIKVYGKSTLMGLGITFSAGISLSLFTALFNLATNDQFHTLKEGVPHLTVYTAFFYFSVSGFVVAAILNTSFLYHPVLGLPRSSLKAYLRDQNGRCWALLAGLLCGFGNGFQFMGGEAAGYAAADAVQALPLVSTFWAVVLLGEHQKSSRRTYILLGGMLVMFVVAVGLLVASAGHRTQTHSVLQTDGAFSFL